MSNQQSITKRTSDPLTSSYSVAVSDFVRLLATQLPGFSVGVDVPLNSDGQWFIDVSGEEFSCSIVWRKSMGFGFFTGDLGYGDRPNEMYEQPDLAVKRAMQLAIQQRSGEPIAPAWLAELRQLLEKPQTEMATLLSMTQSAVSRFESREDFKVQTLASYIEAMGGRLELRVHLPGMDIAIAPPTVGRAVR
ncbi:hypothetical protein [Xanthomonas axonopodis]|uniref:hypothetical protein n=1 Tax=Xanthomonas axonopodis TaxID=53413 RepID=UPI0035579A3F